MKLDRARLIQRTESFDGSEQFHAIVGGGRNAAADLAALRPANKHRRPATRTRIPVTRAV